jgi:chitinase
LEAPGLGLVAHHFSCPSGLLFNKQADSCDYARNVYCTVKQTTTEVPPAPVFTTKSTTAKPTTTSTTERATFNKVSSIYKNPSRTTQRTTTTAQSIIDEIDITSDVVQEDPKVSFYHLWHCP